MTYGEYINEKGLASLHCDNIPMETIRPVPRTHMIYIPFSGKFVLSDFGASSRQGSINDLSDSFAEVCPKSSESQSVVL